MILVYRNLDIRTERMLGIELTLLSFSLILGLGEIKALVFGDDLDEDNMHAFS